MLPKEAREVSPQELAIRNQENFTRLVRLFGFDTVLRKASQGDWKKEEGHGRLDLEDGYHLEARYRLTWIEVVVMKGDEGAIGFVMWNTGLESVSSRNPSLVSGENQVRLQQFGIGLEGGFTSLYHPSDQSDAMDELGEKLVGWLEESAKSGVLQPFDLAIKFPLLPSAAEK